MENPFAKLVREEGEILAEENKVADNNLTDSEGVQVVNGKKEE